ncbi:glycosyltransferase [Pseudomonas viridiflava]|uniref:glycosyltransferase n=1 Tax=Pseudomonas atacamensis TaxID=2565368 RepID=UPI000F055AA8
MLTLSTVTPVYSGQEYLKDFVLELEKTRNKLVLGSAPIQLQEAIFVVDEAIDNSASILTELANEFEWIRVVYLSRNYGQHPATIAGILHSSGDWIATLDEDLQHPPSEIINLLSAAILQSKDVAYAKPVSAVHESMFRDFGSRGFKRLMEFFTGNKKISSFNSFRLMRGGLARAAASVCSHDTYFDIALTWFTNRIISVPLTMKDQRVISGEKSGYSFKQLLSHARRMAISSNTKLLRYAGLAGLISFLASIVLVITTIIKYFYFPESIDVHGWPSLFTSILFFGGLLGMLSAIIAEYLMVAILHLNGKPTFYTVDRSQDKLLTHFFKE